MSHVCLEGVRGPSHQRHSGSSCHPRVSRCCGCCCCCSRVEERGGRRPHYLRFISAILSLSRFSFVDPLTMPSHSFSHFATFASPSRERERESDSSSQKTHFPSDTEAGTRADISSHFPGNNRPATQHALPHHTNTQEGEREGDRGNEVEQ